MLEANYFINEHIFFKLNVSYCFTGNQLAPRFFNSARHVEANEKLRILGNYVVLQVKYSAYICINFITFF